MWKCLDSFPIVPSHRQCTSGSCRGCMLASDFSTHVGFGKTNVIVMLNAEDFDKVLCGI